MTDIGMQTPNYKTLLPIFTLDNEMTDEIRINEIKKLFEDNIIPFTNKALSKIVIRQMIATNEIQVLSSVEGELGKLMAGKPY